jgi:S-DNA-T family DNA segregation ATPase FtsK/SpoIIIE
MRRIQGRVSALWERSPYDADFLSLRLGNGEQPSSIRIITPKQEEYEQDPLIKEAQQLAREFEKVSDVPVLLPLNKAHVVGVVGDRASMLNSMRSLVLQLVTHHSPDEVKIVSFYSEEESDQWDWIRWLPHVWDDQRKRRFLATNPREARELTDYLYEILNRRKRNRKPERVKDTELPYWVFIISDPRLIEDEIILPILLKESEKVGVRTLLLAESKNTLPMECHAILEIHKNNGTLQETNYLQTGEDWEYSFQPDFVSVEVADQTARALAPVRLKANKSRQIPQILTLFDLLEAKSLDDLDAPQRWAQNRFPNTLPVSVGMGTGGKRVYLNIHDKIERKGHGPHGLIAGTTGSGKSEVIQALIASLALNYHPHDIVFLLIDYKGGGMSNTFEHLPHLVGSITNLDGNLIERAKVSLKAELMRREKLFKDAGNLQHIDEYYQSPLREKNPLPHLVIIIDEFAELKKEQPEFMNELISIAAKGRTLGVHLILATQKPSGVVDDKIWSNARFRICLRVQDEADSREMIKIPDASWITTPGRGYFQVGSNELLELVQFAWSGAPYRPENESAQEVVIKEVTLTGRRINRSASTVSSTNKKKERNKKQLHVLVDYLSQEAEKLGIKPLQGPWLPPLPKQITLDELLPPERKGWDGQAWQPTDSWLNPVVGLVDEPVNQTQYPLRIPLNEGHLPVYGMPGTGKTTFVQTMLFSLALDHSPDDVHMYVLDFGHMFRDFAELPHMGAIIRDDEPDRVRRLFRFLLQEMHRRREQIAQSGAKTFYSYRKSVSEPVPAIVVVIDGYLTFKSTFEEEHNDLEQLLRAGGSFGIYFIVTTNQISDMFDRVRNNFSLGVSFELADPADYYFAVGRLRTPLANLPEGRGFVKGNVPPLEFQTALSSEGRDEIERASTLRQRIRLLADSWQGNHPKAIEALPERIELVELLAKHANDPNQPELSPLQVPVAISMDDLTPYYVSLKDGPYFVVGGSIEGGKTSFLQTWILSLAYFHPPTELEIYAIDFRPSALGLSALMGIPHLKPNTRNSFRSWNRF